MKIALGLLILLLAAGCGGAGPVGLEPVPAVADVAVQDTLALEARALELEQELAQLTDELAAQQQLFSGVAEILGRRLLLEQAWTELEARYPLLGSPPSSP